jgi:hypothetical protein
MNKPQNPNQTLIQLILRAQLLAQQDVRAERGYAMMMTSIISIVMLSMLAAYTTMTNLSKSSTNAYVDGTNSFYAAESGLNKRAQQFREKFDSYSNPSGTVPTSLGSTAVTAANVANCFSISVGATINALNDFECRNYPFKYNNNIAAARTTSDEIVLSEGDDNNNTSNYVAHTFVAPKQDYATRPPNVTIIPPGEPYTGLRALEYQYTVYATATKRNNTDEIAPSFTAEQKEAKGRIVKEPGDAALIVLYDAEQARVDALNNASSATNSSTNSVLQMNFRNRVVPLFQFAAFYDGDLEMNSSSNMTIGGRVHTNANFYTQPNTGSNTITTSFLSPITAVGKIYNRVDAAFPWNGPGGGSPLGISRLLMTGDNCATGTCTSITRYPGARTVSSNELSATQLAAFGGRIRDGGGGTTRLNTPPPGFIRKRNYHASWTGNTSTTDSNSGEYYAKADMRLEMVPDRDADTTTAAPWTRNKAIIPFNFTAIRVGGTGTCTTTLPAKDPAISTATTTPPDGIPTLANDPAANYIDADRNNAANLNCTQFTKGQLQSLRQPVMVLTDLNQPNTAYRTATGAAPIPFSEAGVLNRSGVLGSTLLPPATTLSVGNDAKDRILRALQVAIVSTPTPIAHDSLNLPLTNAALATVNAEFTRLINTPTMSALLPAGSADRANLLAATPNQIAAIRNAWFLPAPVQRSENSQPQVQIPANIRNSGFYDGRERRWITMLQTNIASLSVWNRDGLYVEDADTSATSMRNPYSTNATLQDAAFNNGLGANSTDGFAFTRAATIPTNPKALQWVGLGSTDMTEGGLVLHASVSDDLNGDGVIDAVNDVSLDNANPIKKRDAIGDLVGADNNPVTATNPEVIIDYPRKYRGGASSQSPFGFAFNGGNYLPGALTLVTDQPIYVQGDFNNNGITTNVAATDRLPASIIGDVITTLSNQCLATSSALSDTPLSATNPNTPPNHLGVPASQFNCGLPRASLGSVNVTVAPSTTAATVYPVITQTTVNAAFLSNTMRSRGNLGTGRGWTATAAAGNTFSGALNNYMRMLEDWGGTRFFNYTGSFVSLGTPIEVNGVYVGGGGTGLGSYYGIPQRNFNFDANFNNFNLLPPLPPRATYLQQEVFKRSYN